jgi:hypothetical protein
MTQLLLVKLVVFAGLVALLLSAILVEERRHNLGVLDTVKPQQVPAEPGWADEIRNYRQ